jgi:hypothetical protein
MKRMSQYWLVAVFTLLVGVVGLTGEPFVPTASAAISPVDVQSFGATYGEWSARWWQWAISIPVAVNPILAPDGAIDCALGQTGNVWFLAGNFGNTSVRTCTIPAGKPLFFPVFNFVVFDPFTHETILDLRMQAAEPIDAATDLEATIDGKRAAKDLRAFRVQSPVFSTVIPTAPPPLPAPDPGPFLLSPGLHSTMVTDGYWLLLEPLKPGHHTINFKAKGSGGFSLDVTYNLTVQ